jgi:hypothetical protein
MNDLRIKVRLDIASDAEDTCEGCRWGLPKRNYSNGETDPRVLRCKLKCSGCGDDSCRADRDVLRSRAACHHYQPKLRARQVRALEGILAMMKRERVDRAGEALSRDVGASVAEAVADAKRAPGHLRGPFNDPGDSSVDTHQCPNCPMTITLPPAGTTTHCTCGTKLTLHHDDLITVEPPDNP